MSALYIFAAILGGGLLLMGMLGGEADGGDALDADMDLGGKGGGWKHAFSFQTAAYALAAFGLTGSLLSWLGAPPLETLLASGVMGMVGGGLVGLVFRWLKRSQGGFAETSDQYIGGIGRTEVRADVKIAEERNTLRVRQAELDEQADSREKSAVENARRAEAEAREKAETVRALAEARRLEADVIAPARAQREAAEQEAQAQAAPIRERGRAEAEVLKLLYAEIEQAGDMGLHVFTLEKLPEFLRIAGETAGAIDIDRLVVMDGGDGAGAAQAMQQRPQAMMKLIEQMAGYVGIEPDTLIRTLAYRAAGGDGAARTATPAEAASTTAAAKAVAARSGNGNPEEATP